MSIPARPEGRAAVRSWEYRSEFPVFARPGVIGLSPYFCNTVEDLERVLAALRRPLH